MARRKPLRAKAIARDGKVCALCGKRCARPRQTGWTTTRKDSAAVDHVVPLWLGGPDRLANVRVVCERCHAAKTKREATLRAKVRRKARKHAEHRRRMKERGRG